MDKSEKFGFIKLFTGFLWMAGYDPRVLVATSAANTGIDNGQLQLMNCFGFLPCPTTLLQERGRNACVAGMTGSYITFTPWMIFVKLALSMFLPFTKSANEPSEYEGINTIIPSLSPDRPTTPASSRPTAATIPCCPLSADKKKQNFISAHDDLIDVLNLSVLPDLGCIHCRHEWYMAMVGGILIRLGKYFRAYFKFSSATLLYR